MAVQAVIDKYLGAVLQGGHVVRLVRRTIEMQFGASAKGQQGREQDCAKEFLHFEVTLSGSGWHLSRLL